MILTDGVTFTSVRYDRRWAYRLFTRPAADESYPVFVPPPPISLSMDLLLTAAEHVHRRDVTDGTVQADIVVMFHVALHQPPRILQLVVMSSHPMNRPAPISVFSAQRRTKSTI